MELAGKVAIVTGAGRGIGRAIALELGGCGADVAFCNRNAEARAGVKGEIEALGRKCLAVETDVGDAEQMQKFIEQVIKTWGRVDILVNNAGLTKDGLLLRMSVSDWREVMRVNLDGSFYAIRGVVKQMVRQRWGRIVNIGSVLGSTGNAGQANYASSKAALLGLTKSVAKELGSRGITCNAVAPGFIETAMTEVLEEKQRSHLLAGIPLGRIGQAEEVARVVRFLASEDASYITGEVLHVNGGMF